MPEQCRTRRPNGEPPWRQFAVIPLAQASDGAANLNTSNISGKCFSEKSAVQKEILRTILEVFDFFRCVHQKLSLTRLFIWLTCVLITEEGRYFACLSVCLNVCLSMYFSLSFYVSSHDYKLGKILTFPCNSFALLSSGMRSVRQFKRRMTVANIWRSLTPIHHFAADSCNNSLSFWCDRIMLIPHYIPIPANL